MPNTTPKRDPSYFESCPVIYSLNVLSKKWLIPIICQLNAHGTMRFNALQRAVDGITNMMLTQCLKELQGLGLVSRMQYNEMPLRVEYSLTPVGQDLMPSIYGLSNWAMNMNWTCDESKLCVNSDCPAHNMQLINIRQNEFSDSSNHWDSFYEAAVKLIQSKYDAMDPLEKMAFIMEYTISSGTVDGERMSRLRNIYYVIGADKSEEFLDNNRAVFRILHELLDEGRRQRLVTDDLSDDEIIHAFMSFSHGMVAYWELVRGAYDIAEKNHNIIVNFINSFRKK